MRLWKSLTVVTIVMPSAMWRRWARFARLAVFQSDGTRATYLSDNELSVVALSP